MALKNFADLLRVQQQFAGRIATPAEGLRAARPPSTDTLLAGRRAALDDARAALAAAQERVALCQVRVSALEKDLAAASDLLRQAGAGGAAGTPKKVVSKKAAATKALATKAAAPAKLRRAAPR